MANVQKYTKANVQGLSIHWDRKTENHTNKDIDVERSHLNYDLCEKEGDSLSRLNERLAEVHCLNRKDVNHCACWVVTLPKELQEKTDVEQRAFFEKTYEFLAERYGGEKNVISANVHNDETTPHMHFAFVPTVFDQKRNMDKVCAKKVVSRKDLQSFHTDLDKFLKEQIPHIYEKGILNGETVDVKNVKELKEFGDEIKQQRAELEREKEEINQERQALQVAKKQTQKSIEKTKKMKAKAENCFNVELELNDLTNQFKRDWRGRTIVEKEPLNEFKKYVRGVAKTAMQDYRKLESALESNEELKNDLSKQSKELERLENQNATLKNELDEKNYSLTIFKSWLKDTGRTDFKITHAEYCAREVLETVEQGIKPKTSQRCKAWRETLEEGVKRGYIPENRFKNAVERLKTWLSDLLNKERKQEQKRSKSRDMGR